MNSFLPQVFSLLLTHPGALAYNLVLAFSILAALLAGLNQARSSPNPQAAQNSRRMLAGLGLLLVFRLALFLIAGLVWQGLISFAWVLPLVERSIDLMSLVVIAWLWVFPAFNLPADLSALILLIVILGVTLRGLTGGLPLSADQFFNGSTPDGYAQAACVGLAMLGIILLVVRRPAGWPMGLIMLAVLGAGHFAQLWLPIPGDYSGAVRLTQMIAYPLLIVIPFRQQVSAAPHGGLAEGQSGATKPSIGTDPSFQELVIEWSLAEDPRQAGVQLAARLAGELQAEICLFFWPPDEQGMILGRYGYDLVHRIAVPDLRLTGQALPVLSQAFQQGNILALPGNSTAPDLSVLAQSLDLQRSGSLLSAPVKTDEGIPLLQIVMLLPFSGRRWSAADQEHLGKLCRPLAYILQRNRQIAEMEAELAQTRQVLQSSQERVLKAENDRRTLLDMVTIMQQMPGSDGVAAGYAETALPTSGPAAAGTRPPAPASLKISGDGVERAGDAPPASPRGSDRE